MKEFENKSFIKLMYHIIGWCVANKKLPHAISMWVQDGEEPMHKALVHFYPEKNDGKPKEEIPAEELIIMEEYAIETEKPFGYPDVVPKDAHRKKILEEIHGEIPPDELQRIFDAYANT